MFRRGHIGVTAGIASALGAVWNRERTKEFLANHNPCDSLFERVRNRKKLVLPPLAFTGCATVVSGSLDELEQRLGFEHRTAGHSLPIFGAIAEAAELAIESAAEVVRWVSDRAGYSGDIDPIVAELKDLGSWVLDGMKTGWATHILGDIPGGGEGGFAALNALYPLSDKRFNLPFLPSIVSTTVSKIATIVGGAITAASWVVIGAHLVSPRLPEASVKDALSALVSLGRKTLTGDVEPIYERATGALARVENVLRDAFLTAGNGLSRWAHNLRVTVQNLVDVTGDGPYPEASI